MQTIHFAERMSRLGTESAFEVLAKANALAAQGKDVIHLEIGQPDFATPRNIIDSAYDAMRSGSTGYTDAQGMAAARRAIAEYCAKYKNVAARPEEVVVTPGAKPILFYLMLALCQAGDEVIYPDPGFPIYESCIRFCGAAPVPIPLLQKNGFRIDPAVLRAQISGKTKLIILNSPNNPTGGVLHRCDVEAIAQVVRESGTDAFILSDEVYDRLIFGGESAFSIKSIPDMYDRTILLDGLSKTYSMTGWRLGYGVMNRELAQGITRLIINSTSCAAAFTQAAAIEALTGPQESTLRMREAFEARAEYTARALRAVPGIDCLMPEGSFYVFPSICGLGVDDRTFADRLLCEAGVAVLAGSAFGAAGAGHLRLSVANSMENIRRAVERIADFVNTGL